MANKPYDEEQEDLKQEYKPEDSLGEANYEYKDDKVVKPKRKFKFSAKPIIAIIIVLVAAGFIYKIVQVVKHSPRNKAVPIAEQINRTTAQQEKQDELAKIASETKSVAETSSKQVSSNSAAIQKLQQSQVQTQQKLAGVEQSMQQVNQQLAMVSASVQQLADTIKAQEKAKADAKVEKQKQDSATRNKMQYYVQAVIPGRAWLKSATGSAITVSVGDSLKGYGKVLAIDPYSGAVTTSSGVVIQYAVTQG